MTKDPGSEFSDQESQYLDPEGQGPGNGNSWFGHPKGLSTLFFTELWERFSYYGMRALLVLFMTAAIATEGGMGLSEKTAGAIYGLYTSLVYLLALPGGWVADKIWGQRKAVFVGGVIIAMGHFTIAAPLIGLPGDTTFYMGLVLIVIGTGLLKPNVSTIVGELYPEGGARRDAGFSIFYMGINIGAVAGPLICGLLGEKIDWHWGFSAAGFGMLLGLIQYKAGGKLLGTAGLLQTGEEKKVVDKRARNFYMALGVIALVILSFVMLVFYEVLDISLSEIATYLGIGIVLLTVLFFAFLSMSNVGVLAILAVSVASYLISNLGFDIEPNSSAIYAVVAGVVGYLVIYGSKLIANYQGESLEKKRVFVIYFLFLFAALFWAGFEQAGSSMNLFARDLTDRVVLGWEVPASTLQTINPIFIIIFAPVFGYLWTYLAHIRANPPIPVKFALGLLGLAAGFFVISWGAANASVDDKVLPTWLIVTYFLHTTGELCLSPVGLSSITKLAPRGRVGQMMGIWFIAAALGNLFAGLVAGELETLPPTTLFWQLALAIGIGGLVALALSPVLKKLMGDIK
jgi:POT family proton-dependent oligopeptide transporter